MHSGVCLDTASSAGAYQNGGSECTRVCVGICRAKQAMCWTMANYISFRYQYLFPFVNTYKTLPAPTKTPGMMQAQRNSGTICFLLVKST